MVEPFVRGGPLRRARDVKPAQKEKWFGKYKVFTSSPRFGKRAQRAVLAPKLNPGDDCTLSHTFRTLQCAVVYLCHHTHWRLVDVQSRRAR